MEHRSRRWVSGLALLASLHLLLFYGLPASILLVILAALAVLYFRSGAIAAVATTISLAIATGLGAFAIHLLGLDEAVYYRPHERLVVQDYAKGHRAYRPNAEIRMRMPHGDLQALTREPLAQPRDTVFRTDSEGFRNDHDYREGDIVLLGDSFVVGLGDSQPDTLSAQLEKTHGIPTYNLGHPGDVSDYLHYLEAFRSRHAGQPRVMLFLFEGNDFPEATEYQSAEHETQGLVERWAGRYYSLFTDTAFYRVTKSLYKRAIQSSKIAQSTSVEIKQLGGQRMGLYTPYVQVNQRLEYAMPDAMQQDLIALGAQVEQIFFIPTKYRVYAKHLGATDLPNAQWQALSTLCRPQGWRCTDLTPALVAASDALLAEGKFTWWRDDSHWNREGMAVAARTIATSLNAHQDAKADAERQP